MRNIRKAAITEYRERRKRQGVVRIAMQVRREDARLLRSVVSALSDPARAAEVRALLKAKSLKELLADASLDGIDLDRGGHLARQVEL